MKAQALVVPAIVAWILCSPAGRAADISTAEIVAQTTEAALACMQWMPTGVCFWLRCSYSGCRVRTSVKIGQYNPDFVVSAYNELGENPWSDVRSILGSAQRSAASGELGWLGNVPVDSAGNRTEGSSTPQQHKNLVYRETDAIGHPLSSIVGLVSSLGYSCASQTTSFVPYFQSALDALAWRQDIPEVLYPESWAPGMREVGTWPLQTWGGVYPRTGWTTQAEEPKAAALNAQRAGDIVTRSAQPHVYLPLSAPSASNQRVWPPGELIETDASTGTWQMLAPQAETSCAVFGSNDLASAAGWGGGRVDPEGDYVWTLWRPYQCCRRRGQLFLYSIDWTEYPP